MAQNNPLDGITPGSLSLILQGDDSENRVSAKTQNIGECGQKKKFFTMKYRIKSRGEQQCLGDRTEGKGFSGLHLFVPMLH